MQSKQFLFFLTFLDVCEIFRDVERIETVNYIKTGLYDIPENQNYSSFVDIPYIGYALNGDSNKIDNYLIMPANLEVNIREIPQKKGGLKYGVDQLINKESIEIKFGGIYMHATNTIIGGRCATVSNDKFSKKLFDLVFRKIKSDTIRIGSFYVGKEAHEKLKLGWRLVLNEKLSKEYDLTLTA